jgi:hypothetical protein
MKQLEFGVSCLDDIRVLLKVWQRVLVLEGLEDSRASIVPVIIEDRRPGEEVRLAFTAEQRILNRFLSTLTEANLEYLCNDTIPGILTECRVTRDRGALKAIGSNGQRGPEREGDGDED